MIKKFNEYTNESFKPNEGKAGSVKLNISDDELSLFQTEGALRNLISGEKISIINNELWYYKDDEKTIDILNNYFNVNESNDLDSIIDDNFYEYDYDKILDIVKNKSAYSDNIVNYFEEFEDSKYFYKPKNNEEYVKQFLKYLNKVNSNESVKTFEDFNNLKELVKGVAVLYKGTSYSVEENDGFTLTLKNEDGKIDVNYSMFNKFGRIK